MTPIRTLPTKETAPLPVPSSLKPETPPLRFDALLPVEMAVKAESIGVDKAHMTIRQTFVLAILAGAFVALGSLFSATVTAGAGDFLSFGVTRLLGGLAFCLGLILVVVAGAELFTGNNLIVMAWADRRISLAHLLRNWLIVYMGNFVGSIATALLIFWGRQYMFGGGIVGANLLAIANSKSHLEFGQAVALGILCNGLVCLAVWLCYSARTTTDKIVSILFPVTAFVAAGFEHSVANMFFIPMALFIQSYAPQEFWTISGLTPLDFPHLTWTNFWMANLLPVTIGNIIGGSLLVGLVYWFIYLRKQNDTPG